MLKFRYRQQSYCVKGDKQVIFAEPQRAITPGRRVSYDGGIIDRLSVYLTGGKMMNFMYLWYCHNESNFKSSPLTKKISTKIA